MIVTSLVNRRQRREQPLTVDHAQSRRAVPTRTGGVAGRPAIRITCIVRNVPDHTGVVERIQQRIQESYTTADSGIAQRDERGVQRRGSARSTDAREARAVDDEIVAASGMCRRCPGLLDACELFAKLRRPTDGRPRSSPPYRPRPLIGSALRVRGASVTPLESPPDGGRLNTCSMLRATSSSRVACATPRGRGR